MATVNGVVYILLAKENNTFIAIRQHCCVALKSDFFNFGVGWSEFLFLVGFFTNEIFMRC